MTRAISLEGRPIVGIDLLDACRPPPISSGVAEDPLEISPIGHVIGVGVPVVEQLVAGLDRGLVAAFPFTHRGVGQLALGDVGVDAEQPGGSARLVERAAPLACTQRSSRPGA